jgi:hypothetical protein
LLHLAGLCNTGVQRMRSVVHCSASPLRTISLEHCIAALISLRISFTHGITAVIVCSAGTG